MAGGGAPAWCVASLPGSTGQGTSVAVGSLTCPHPPQRRDINWYSVTLGGGGGSTSTTWRRTGPVSAASSNDSARRAHRSGATWKVSSGSSAKLRDADADPGCLPGLRPDRDRESVSSRTFHSTSRPPMVDTTTSRNPDPGGVAARRSDPPTQRSDPPAWRSPDAGAPPSTPARGHAQATARPTPPTIGNSTRQDHPRTTASALVATRHEHQPAEQLPVVARRLLCA